MKILVVDDEPLARERLLRLLARIEPQATSLEAEDGREALAIIERESPELVLLDIRMPDMDGIAVAAQVDTMRNPPALIFCTAYDDHALEALQHQVVAYLLKPVREEALVKALDSAGRVNRVQLQQLQSGSAADHSRRYVTSQTHRGMASVPLDEVRCFMAEDKYVTAYSADNSLVIPDSLKELEETLPEGFLRVHRNALVALRFVESLQREDTGAWYLQLQGSDILPQVSRRHLRAVKEALRAR